MNTLTVLVVVVALEIFRGVVHADQTAVAFDSSQLWSTAGGSGVYGWQFTARTDLQIISLGIYDSWGTQPVLMAGDGLAESHVIGIWETDQPSKLVTSSLIPVALEARLENGFRYTDISPVLLRGGHGYVIAAAYAGLDTVTGDYNNPDFAPVIADQILITGYRSSGSSTLAFPETYVSGHLFAFGPNFVFRSVPEPSVFSLGALMCSILLIRRKSRSG